MSSIKNRTHQALLQQLRETFALSHKVLRRTDPADVKSMSSAFQKLYLAFSDLDPFVTVQSLPIIQISLRGIVDALGEIRSQDMAVLALEKVAPQAPLERAQTIQQSIETRKKIRRKSRQTLERFLVSLGENILNAEFEKIRTLGDHHSRLSRRGRGVSSLKNLPTSIIHSNLSEFEKCSTLLNESTHAMSLVAIDRATQRLHYAIELFADCWTSDVRPFSKSLANLQSTLSKVSSYDTLLKELRKQILDSKKTGRRGTRRPSVFLFTQFIELRNFHFEESFAIWNAWESDQLGSELRKMTARPI